MAHFELKEIFFDLAKNKLHQFCVLAMKIMKNANEIFVGFGFAIKAVQSVIY